MNLNKLFAHLPWLSCDLLCDETPVVTFNSCATAAGAGAYSTGIALA